MHHISRLAFALHTLYAILKIVHGVYLVTLTSTVIIYIARITKEMSEAVHKTGVHGGIYLLKDNDGLSYTAESLDELSLKYLSENTGDVMENGGLDLTQMPVNVLEEVQILNANKPLGKGTYGIAFACLWRNQKFVIKLSTTMYNSKLIEIDNDGKLQLVYQQQQTQREKKIVQECVEDLEMDCQYFDILCEPSTLYQVLQNPSAQYSARAASSKEDMPYNDDEDFFLKQEAKKPPPREDDKTILSTIHETLQNIERIPPLKASYKLTHLRDPKLVLQILKEAQTMKQHPGYHHIHKILHFDRDIPCVISEICDGSVNELNKTYTANEARAYFGHFHNVMKYGSSIRQSVMSKEWLSLAYQVGQALLYMESRGLAHLDIKMDNIFYKHIPFGKHGAFTYYLSDFGLCAPIQTPVADVYPIAFHCCHTFNSKYALTQKPYMPYPISIYLYLVMLIMTLEWTVSGGYHDISIQYIRNIKNIEECILEYYLTYSYNQHMRFFLSYLYNINKDYKQLNMHHLHLQHPEWGFVIQLMLAISDLYATDKNHNIKIYEITALFHKFINRLGRLVVVDP